MSQDILLISPQMLKDRSMVHGNVEDKLIYPDIKVCQDMYIHPILGTALYNKIQTDISAATITGNYKTLLDKYIVDALIHYTIERLQTSVSFQLWNKGVVRKQGQDTELPSMSELFDLSSKYKITAEFYANRLRKYLKQNASAMFPEYLNPGSGIDDIHPDNKTFTSPVYLGEDDCPKTYAERYQGNNPSC